MVSHRPAAPKVFLLACVVSGVSLASVFVQGGCTGNECAYDELHPERPVEGGLDCPPDQSCYIGQCFRQCNPGVERNEPCTTNDDCTKGEIPNCLFVSIAGSFCSTCEEGQTCVLGLNICQPVADIPDPEEPSPTMSNVPLPLDGGQIDASTFEDAGVDMPMATQVDYAGYVTLMQVTDYVAGTGDTAVGDVSICDVSNATDVLQDQTLSAIDFCELRTVKRYVGTSTPADLGSVRWEPDEGTPDAMTLEDGVSASYEPAPAIRDYRFEEVLPARLLVYSTAPPSNHKYVNFSGSGLTGVALPWTSSNGGLLLIPYQLVPSGPTELLLENAPIEVSLNSPLDLSFEWNLLPTEAGGSDLGISVIVEIGGQRSPCENDDSPAETYVIRCQLNEAFLSGDPRLTIPSALISEYIANVGPFAGERVPVSFGRIRSEQILFFNDDESVSSLIDLYFGQEYRSEIIFVSP
jgi:hypothetical protein